MSRFVAVFLFAGLFIFRGGDVLGQVSSETPRSADTLTDSASIPGFSATLMDLMPNNMVIYASRVLLGKCNIVLLPSPTAESVVTKSEQIKKLSLGEAICLLTETYKTESGGFFVRPMRHGLPIMWPTGRDPQNSDGETLQKFLDFKGVAKKDKVPASWPGTDTTVVPLRDVPPPKK